MISSVVPHSALVSSGITSTKIASHGMIPYGECHSGMISCGINPIANSFYWYARSWLNQLWNNTNSAMSTMKTHLRQRLPVEGLLEELERYWNARSLLMRRRPGLGLLS